MAVVKTIHFIRKNAGSSVASLSHLPHLRRWAFLQSRSLFSWSTISTRIFASCLNTFWHKCIRRQNLRISTGRFFINILRWLSSRAYISLWDFVITCDQILPMMLLNTFWKSAGPKFFLLYTFYISLYSLLCNQWDSCGVLMSILSNLVSSRAYIRSFACSTVLPGDTFRQTSSRASSSGGYVTFSEDPLGRIAVAHSLQITKLLRIWHVT
jgi:hypothetical protein